MKINFFPIQFNQCSRDATDASPVDSFITAVKDLCIVNILVKLLNFLFSEVYW